MESPVNLDVAIAEMDLAVTRLRPESATEHTIEQDYCVQIRSRDIAVSCNE